MSKCLRRHRGSGRPSLQRKQTRERNPISCAILFRLGRSCARIDTTGYETTLARVIDIERAFDDQKIGSFHIQLMLLSFLVLMTDGFDTGAAAYAGPGIRNEWSVSGRDLGALFSSSIAAAFIGPPLFGFL